MAEPLVTVYTTVYNHEPYLRQCLDGLVMQKTNFVYECFVHDDASTDGSASIIREYAEKYPDIIRPIIETENQWSKKDGSLNRIISENLHGKYVAICEGDDYWIDPYKLQKQVDILEMRENVSLVYTGFETVDEYSRPMIRPFFDYIKKNSRGGDFLHKLIMQNHVMTLTVCYRKSIRESNLYEKCPFSYDYTLAFVAAMCGDLYYLPESTGCYRRTPGSMIVSHKQQVSKELREVQRYFCKAYLGGKGKERSWFPDLRIRVNIMRLCMYDNELYNDIIMDFPLQKLLYPVAVMVDVFERCKKRMLRYTI